MDRPDSLFPVNLVAGHLEDRELGEFFDGPAVTLHEGLRGAPAPAAILARLAAGQYDAGAIRFTSHSQGP